MVWGPVILGKYYGQIIKLYESFISTAKLENLRYQNREETSGLKDTFLNFLFLILINNFFSNTDTKYDSYIYV